MNTHVIDSWANHWCYALPLSSSGHSLPQTTAHLALAAAFGTESSTQVVVILLQHSENRSKFDSLRTHSGQEQKIYEISL